MITLNEEYQNKLNKIKKEYKNTNMLFEIYLENYHNNYIYIRLDYFKKEHVHKYVVSEKEAKCEETGLKKRTCTRCHHVDEEVIEALGHHFDDPVITLPASCTTDGLMTGECTC